MPFAEQRIHQALDFEEFVPYFQPLVDLRVGSIHGFEILARWIHPDQGLVPPNKFIPLVERYGLINRLSASLLTQAFASARTLPKNFGLSINLSPSQLHDRTLPSWIHRMAEEAEFDLKRLTVELTETALVDDLDLAGAVAADFKKLGVRLALDDFGTGYSSLLHLQSLPFDELKVDISFVRSMVESRQSRKITAAVISLGLSLGLQTVAEGVEQQSQANLLAWQGCTFGQGFLYGRAIPAAELPASLLLSHPGVWATTEVPASIGDTFLSLDAQPTQRLSQLRAIYDSAPVGLAFIDCDLHYVNLNQQLAQINGQSVQAHLGRKVSDIVHPARFNQFEPYLKRALRGEEFPSIEVQTTSLAIGEPAKTLMVSYQPVRDEASEILGVCVSIADISAVKEKEEALRESEDHYRHAVELNPQTPWVMDAQGNNISVSSRWETITGLTAEETKGYGWLDAVHPDDRSRVLAILKTSLVTGAPLDIEYRVRHADGPWIWMRSRGAARRDASGNIIRWYGSVESVDEHKRAVDELRAGEAGLRCSEARLRAIFDSVPVGIVLAESSTGRVLNANPKAEELIGFHFKQNMVWATQGWEAFDSCGKRIKGIHLPLMRAIRSGKATGPKEVRLRRPDGSEIWLRLTAAPVRLEDGEQLGGILIIQDIDTGKREREHLLELARELSSVASGTTYTSPHKIA
jgi:PAS domain S-box-containing protein